MSQSDRPYLVTGNPVSQQAEQSTLNPAATNVQMRILVELQVIAFLLSQNSTTLEDLSQLRADVAASIT